MKHLIFSLLSLIFALSATAEKPFDILPTIKVEANPINIAAVLIQANDTAAITSTLRYYGYTPSTSPAPSNSTPRHLTPETSSLTPDTSKPDTSTSLTPRHLTPETSTSLTPDTSKPDTWIHPNGSNIHLSLPDPITLSDFTIEVTSHGSTKDKENLLEDLNFKKVGNAYEQKNVGFTTRATFALHGTLILKRLPKK